MQKREGMREGGREGGTEGGKEGGRRGREGGREGGRKGGRLPEVPGMPTDLITNGFFSFWFLCFPP